MAKRATVPKRTRDQIRRLTVQVNSAWDHIMKIYAELGMLTEAQAAAEQREADAADEDLAEYDADELGLDPEEDDERA